MTKLHTSAHETISPEADMSCRQRTKRTFLLLAVVIVTQWGVLAQDSSAQHIYSRRIESRMDLFADVQARRVGDLVTILIRESTNVQNNDQRAMRRAAQTGGAFNIGTAFSGDFGRLTGDSTFDSQTQNSGQFDGSSSYSVNRGFTDSITVKVCKVLPNGNLVVSGARRQRIAGEYRTLKISGIVRLVDVRADGSVDSTNVGDLQIAYAGNGDESSFANQGWLGKRINQWWPF